MFVYMDDDGPSLGFRSMSDFGMFCLFISLAFIGIIINVTFLYAAVRERLYQKSRRNVYIMNLALSDLVIAIGILFFPTLNYVIIDSIPFGQVTCKIFEVIRDVVTPVSLLSLAVLSRERYRAVFRAGKELDQSQKPNKKEASYLLCCYFSGANTAVIMWLFSAATLVPISMLGKLQDMPIEDIGSTEICMLGRFEFLEPKQLVLVRCMITYIAPIMFILLNYSAIAWKIFSFSSMMKRLRPGNGAECMTERIMRTTKRIFLLAFLIIICSGPCHYFLWVYFFEQEDVQSHRDFWDTWQIVGFYLFYLYPIVNPVFFYFTSRKYKALFDTYLFRRKPRETTTTGPDDDDDEDEYVSSDHASASENSHDASCA